MIDQYITIDSPDASRIPAIIHRSPDKSRTDRFVVMLHGLTTSKNEYQDAYRRLSAELGRHGIQSLRFDFRGHGDSTSGLVDFNIHSQVLDTLGAIEWVQANAQFEKLTILGTSFGAPPAIFTAYIKGPLVAKLVLLAPVLDLDRTFVHPETGWGKEVFGLETVIQALHTNVLTVDKSFNLTRNSVLDFFLVNPISALRKLDCKISILHGIEDGMVPFAVSDSVAKELSKICFFPLKNTGHGLAELGDESRTSSQTQENMRRLIDELAQGGRTKDIGQQQN